MTTTYLRPTDAAKKLGVHRNTVTKWVKEGVLAGIVLPNGHVRVDASSLDNPPTEHPEETTR